MKTDVFAISFSICYFSGSKPDAWGGLVLWFGPCERGSGKDKNLATLLRGEASYKTEECHSPHLVRIVKGYLKETFLLLRQEPLGIVCWDHRGGFCVWWASGTFLRALWYWCVRKGAACSVSGRRAALIMLILSEWQHSQSLHKGIIIYNVSNNACLQKLKLM